MKRNIFFILLIFAIVGIIDAGYLTLEHFNKILPPCQINHFLPILTDCGLVLQSKYSVLFGIPLAFMGMIHYCILAVIIFLAILLNKKILWIWILLETTAGALFSLYLMGLQIFIIKSICIYCSLSALISFILFFFAVKWLEKERKIIFIYTHEFLYRNILKKIFFLVNPETIHMVALTFGELLGRIPLTKNAIEFFLPIQSEKLSQTIHRIHFKNPVGLAAGFDYHAQLTQILPSLGFGFGSVGTITNLPYGGNPKPMLGRLPKSRSLMVNKGYKNLGTDKTIDELRKLYFKIPVGISIGRTNSKKVMTQRQSVEDVVEAFKNFESSGVKNAYYELNISCPNLYGNISFYPPKNLQELLSALDNLHIRKPVFIKMPIEKTDKEFLAMLEVISNFSFVKGLIIGNLQKNRKDPALDKEEVAKFKVGYFSGKPCEKRSNELIGLTYMYFRKRFIIIGCGGIFTSIDAYKKIKLGATLVQLITGTIYEGPTLIAKINLELIDLLKKDGYKNISDAVGTINLYENEI